MNCSHNYFFHFSIDFFKKINYNKRVIKREDTKRRGKGKETREMTKRETIKRTITTITMMMIIIILFVIINNIETHYNRKGFVSYIDRCNDVVEIEDTTGNVWEWEGDTERFNVGDNVVLKMYNNCTDLEIKDDEILKITLDK